MTDVLIPTSDVEGPTPPRRTARRDALRFLVALFLAFLGFGIAFIAQGLLADRVAPWDGAMLYGLAGYVWIRATRLAWPSDTALRGWGAARNELVRLRAPRYLAYASGLAVVTWVLIEPQGFTRAGTLAWLASLTCLVIAVIGVPRPDTKRAREALMRLTARGLTVRMAPVGLALIAILLVALWFRVHQLPSVPAEVTSDHIEKLLDVRDVLMGRTPVYFERNTGREPLQFYLTAPVAAATGLKLVALQVTTISASLLAIVATFLLGRELLSTGYGLLAAAFMAVSRWDVALARMGLRFELTTLFTALSLLLLLRALRTQRAREYLLCGLSLGLGLVGYSTFRVVPLLVLTLAAAAAYWWGGFGPAERRSVLRGLALAFSAAALVILPMTRYVAQNPGLFWERMVSRVGAPGQPLPGHPLALILDGFNNALLMFNFRGDVGWVHNVGQLPALEQVPAALFVLGAVYVVVRFWRRREIWSGVLLIGIPVLLLPSALSIAFPIENPSFNRASGAIPLVFLVVALVPGLAWALVRRSLPGSAGLVAATVLVLGLLGVAAIQSASLYFGEFARNYRQTVPNSSEIGTVAAGYARDLGGRERIFIVSYPHWVDHRAVGMHMGDITWNNVLMQPDELTRHAGQPAPRVYLLHPQDTRGQSEVRRMFPDGSMLRHSSDLPGKDFLIYLVMDRG